MDVLRAAARSDVVLLGEQHDDADHHRWQMQTVAGLHLLRPDLVIGFEAFPRRVQPVLDAWIAGALTERELLERVGWQKIWNVPAELYLPLFQFARLNRIPIFALNIERSFTRRIAEAGWDAVPVASREGVSRPAPASRAYEDGLLEIYRQHQKTQESRRATHEDAAFRRFVEAQIAWDRAMAEALSARTKGESGPRRLAVGIVGSGHLQHGRGVAHQLRDLGVTRVATFLPLRADTSCGEIAPTLADAIFAIPYDARDPRTMESTKPGDVR